MKRYFLLLFGLTLMLSSCEKTVYPTMVIDKRSVVFGREGGECNIVVFSNSDWTVTTDNKEIEITPSAGLAGGYVTIKVPPTEEVFTKSMRLYFTASNGSRSIEKTLAITQDALPFIICEESVAEVTGEGGKVRFPVNSNFAWEVKSITCNGDPCELAVMPEENEMNTVEVTAIVPANSDGLVKEYAIILYLREFPDKYVVLTIHQAA